MNYLLLFFLVMFWGGSFIAIKFTILAWPPFFAATLRVFVSLLTIIFLLFVLRKERTITFQLRWRVWILGIFALGIPFASLFWGERFISPGLAGILNSTTLIWTFLLSYFIYRKELNFLYVNLIGVFVGFFGIVSIFWSMLVLEKSLWELLGTIAVLIMAMSYAVASVFAQRFFNTYGKLDLYTNLYHQCWAALIFLFLLSILFEKWPSWSVLSMSSHAIIGTLYLGIFSTGLSWLIYYHLIREWGAIRASVTSYLIPITALLNDYIFFHQVPLLSECIGIAIILLALFMLNYSRIPRQPS